MPSGAICQFGNADTDRSGFASRASVCCARRWLNDCNPH